MGSSDSAASKAFKEKLASNNIADALRMALSEAIELKITTWVSDASAPEGSAQTADQPKPGHRMETRINIVDGDINTEIGSLFLSQGPYGELRDFHLQQVQEGRQIIRQNLDSLQQLFGMLVGVAQASHRLPPQTLDVQSLPPSPIQDDR